MQKAEWQVIVDLLRDTNPELLGRIGRRMMNYLFKRNISQINQLMKRLESSATEENETGYWSENQPIPRVNQLFLEQIVEEVFKVAAQELSVETINSMVGIWLKNEQARFLTLAAEKRDIPLAEISNAVRRFAKMPEAPSASEKNDAFMPTCPSSTAPSIMVVA